MAVSMERCLALVLTSGEKSLQDMSTVKLLPERTEKSCMFLDVNKGNQNTMGH